MSFMIDEQIIDYVAENFGKVECQKLKNIHQGGRNNNKGRDYENYFQLFKVFELASQDDIDLDNQLLGMQVLGFVDDICHIDNEKRIKYNYQAKNSSGSAADWTVDISDRFDKQRLVDIHCYHMRKTHNYLLVSDKVKAAQNLTKIPHRLKNIDTCQHFAYYLTLVELINETELSTYISKLIVNNNRSNIDYAAKLILGVMQANHYHSVTDIFKQAQTEGHPNPFVKFRPQDDSVAIPSWVQQILTDASQHITYRLEYNILTIALNTGLVVSVDITLLNQVSKPHRVQIYTIQDLLHLSMSIAAQNLNQPLSAARNGAI